MFASSTAVTDSNDSVNSLPGNSRGVSGCFGSWCFSQCQPDALGARRIPDSFRTETEAQSFEWRAAFIQTYLERDVLLFGPRILVETLHRFWQMLGHNQGQVKFFHKAS